MVTISWRELPDIGPDVLEMTCDSLRCIVERPFAHMPPWHEWRNTGMET